LYHFRIELAEGSQVNGAAKELPAQGAAHQNSNEHPFVGVLVLLDVLVLLTLALLPLAAVPTAKVTGSAAPAAAKIEDSSTSSRATILRQLGKTTAKSQINNRQANKYLKI